MGEFPEIRDEIRGWDSIPKDEIGGIIDNMNERLGLSKEEGFRYNDDGELVMGEGDKARTVGELSEMSDEAFTKFMEKDGFSPEQVEKMTTKAKEKGEPGIKKAKEKFGDKFDDPAKKKAFQNFLKDIISKGLGFAITYEALSAMAQARSGCFLTNKPKGLRQKISKCDASVCSCKKTSDQSNPRKQCCNACFNSGDTKIGEDACGDGHKDVPNYNCPVNNLENSECSSSEVCTSCGCQKDQNYQLCYVKKDAWDVLGSVLSNAGKFIEDIGNDVLKVADAFADSLSNFLKYGIWIIVGVVAAIIIVIACIYGAKAAKEKKAALGIRNYSDDGGGGELGGGSSYDSLSLFSAPWRMRR
jgi:hypothetical protein